MPIIVKGQRPVSLFLKNILTSNCLGIMVLYLVVLIAYRASDYGFDFLNLFYTLLLLHMSHSLTKMYKIEVETYDHIRKHLHEYILKIGFSNKEELAKIFPINDSKSGEIPDEGKIKVIEMVRARVQSMVDEGADSFEKYVTFYAIALYNDYFKKSVDEFNRNHKWLYYGENFVYVGIIAVTLMMLAFKIYF